MIGLAAWRNRLPVATDRLALGPAGLQVSPLCLGLVQDPATVLEAYDAGINFFFVSLDMHWPLYEGTRRGLAMLLSRHPSIRDQIVVGFVSYLDQPLFRVFPAIELIMSVEGLARADLLIGGGVSSPHGFGRLQTLAMLRSMGHAGATAIGATFHQRLDALRTIQAGVLDIAFCRYNSAHPGARVDLFPYLPAVRRTLIYGFNSTTPLALAPVAQLWLRPGQSLPPVTDHYRFALTRPGLDGLLCAPQTPGELRELLDALGKGPLRPDEEESMIALSAAATAGFPPYRY